MKMLVAMRNAGLAAFLLAACDHSDPTGSWAPPPDGPFDDAVVPVRLTYASNPDHWPSLSQDGARLVYTFDKGSADNDRCLGVLPSVGGQRSAEVCDVEASPVLRDGFEHGALSTSGWLAFTRHSGVRNEVTATDAALYLAPVDSLAGVREVFALKQTQPGMANRWDYLIDPVWISDNELAFIGAQAAYIPRGPFLPEDTIYSGFELAKVRIDGATPQITVLEANNGGDALAYDPTTNRFVYLRGEAVYTLPAAGGTGTLLYTLPDNAAETDRHITGVAAGGGKIWITWTRTVQQGTSTSRTTSSIAEITAGGAPVDLHSRERVAVQGGPGSNEGRWARIAAAPDGSRLVIEGRDAPTGDDIYMVELP